VVAVQAVDSQIVSSGSAKHMDTYLNEFEWRFNNRTN
jgi:transposase-like protein